MDMNVSHDREIALTAHGPKLPEIFPVKPDDPGIKAVRVEIVIENEIDDARSAAGLQEPEQEGAAFAGRVASAFTQPRRQSPPQKPGAGELTLRGEPSTDSRRN
jgi:hypothetical protein